MTMVLRHLLIVSGLLFSLSAFAAETATTLAEPTTSTTSSTIPTTVAIPGVALVDGWQATGHVSLTNQLESRAVSDGITSDVKFSASPAAGLGIRFGRVQDHSLGFMVGLNYEFNRQVDSVNISNKNGNGGGGIKDKTTRFSMFVPEANMTYGFNDRFYGLGGINYPFPQTTEFDDLTMRGEIGTQVGVGTMANQNLNVEVLYRTINLPWYTSDGYSLESKLWGVMLRAGYSL